MEAEGGSESWEGVKVGCGRGEVAGVTSLTAFRRRLDGGKGTKDTEERGWWGGGGLWVCEDGVLVMGELRVVWGVGGSDADVEREVSDRSGVEKKEVGSDQKEVISSRAW